MGTVVLEVGGGEVPKAMVGLGAVVVLTHPANPTLPAKNNPAARRMM